VDNIIREKRNFFSPKNRRKILAGWSREYKKGFLSFFILTFILEKPMYGYEIHQRLAELLGRDGFIQGSSIYQILKKFQKMRLVSSYWQASPQGPKRRYYQLNDSGVALLEEFAQETAFPAIRAAVVLGQTHYPRLWNERLIKLGEED